MARRTIPAQTGETILVCDDDLSVLEFLGDALKGAGYHVVSVHDGRSVLPALEANPSIRLLVVDFAMPEMNGAAVVRQVRAYRPDLPILMITGKTEPDAVQTEIPTVPILSKPFRQEQLAARVERVAAANPRGCVRVRTCHELPAPIGTRSAIRLVIPLSRDDDEAQRWHLILLNSWQDLKIKPVLRCRRGRR